MEYFSNSQNVTLDVGRVDAMSIWSMESKNIIERYINTASYIIIKQFHWRLNANVICIMH